MNREIKRCLKRDRDIGRKAVLRHVKALHTLHSYITLIIIASIFLKLQIQVQTPWLDEIKKELV